ncbi:MAG: hydrogenase maturation protease [Candidatus Calescibacterium sp.]|nr:hydrogenase maturation protease [Candidatus Calescibacterium sp.]MCX7734043.1 hydrogenase maturation protease [bacterium]MDW8087038.1 hydrogenase maturation protease [Candidatus Calescibacterium sp.]
MDKKKILLVGVGNELRKDDALGPEFVRRFDNKNLDKLCLDFPDIQIAEKIAQYDVVIFVDASTSADECVIYELSEKSVSGALSHGISCKDIFSFAKAMYNPKLVGFLIEIRGYDFDYGNQISQEAERNLKRAYELLKDLLARL